MNSKTIFLIANIIRIMRMFVSKLLLVKRKLGGVSTMGRST